MHSAKGYDGQTINVGDRVELHPATDAWMQGDRFGIATRITDRVHIRMDKSGKRRSAEPHLVRRSA
jgi:hypothetical protein